ERIDPTAAEPDRRIRPRARGARLVGLRRAELLHRATLLGVGVRLPDLQRGVVDERALYRRGARGERRRATEPGPLPGDRDRRLGLPARGLLQHRRDDHLGAVGGDDRVHDDGPDLPPDAHARRLAVQHRLRAGPLRAAAGGAGALLRGRSRRGEPPRGDADPARRQHQFHRVRDHGGEPAAALPGAGRGDDLRHLLRPAARLGRLLPGLGAAGLDGGDGHRLPGHVRAGRDACRAPGRRPDDLARRRPAADPAPRRARPAAGDRGLQLGGAVREADGAAEAERV
ncbi:MAG: Efflux ABC transporter, permease protein, partial [uncultured Thermomicrobiales bacterium]